MKQKPKIDVVKLNQLLRQGKTGAQCAEYFGVSPSAISQARQGLNVSVIKNVALENAGRVVDKSLNSVDQLQKINDQANELLDTLEKKPELKLKVMSEIRGQLKLQLEIFQTLYDMRAVEEFQKEVLQCIADAAPELRDQVVRNLNDKRAIRTAIRIN